MDRPSSNGGPWAFLRETLILLESAGLDYGFVGPELAATTGPAYSQSMI